METYEWKKMYYNHLNGKSVHKYVSDNSIQLRVEDSHDNVFAAIDFANENELAKWLDNVVSENEDFYNHASATQSLIDAIM